MSETILSLFFLTLINVGLWVLVLSKRARRVFVRGLVRDASRSWPLRGVNRENMRSGELTVFCVSLILAIAFALFTVVGVFISAGEFFGLLRR